MRCGSLFTGIRGLDMAVEWAGHETVWMCEKDPHARKVLERCDVPIYGDVTELDFTEVEPVDLLIGGGFPCQPFSSAGKRKGGDDERFLWPEVARAVRTLRPRVVVLENVADILRFGREYGLILSDLAEAGYVCRWACLRASDVGAPHGRNRWFAVAHPEGDPRWIIHGEHEVVTDSSRVQPEHGRGRRDVACKSGDIEGKARERERGGDAARNQGSTVADSDGRGRQQIPQRNGHQETGLETLARRNDADGPVWGAYEPAIRRWERVMGPAPTPTRPNDRTGKAELSAGFVEWMMGLPRGHVTDVLPNRHALKCLGNAVVPQQGFYALTQLGSPQENQKESPPPMTPSKTRVERA